MKRCSRIAIVWLLAVVGIAPAALGQGVSGEEGSGKSGNFLTDLGRDGLALPNWENAYWLLGGTGLTLGAYAIEDAAGARRALDRGFIDPLVDTGNIYGDQLVQVPLALTVWSYGHFRDDEAVACMGYDLVRAHSLNYAVTGAMKMAIDRTRPNGESYSFPSGHSSAVFATAGVVSRHYGPRVTGLAVGFGMLTCLGRMEDLKHYASDVAAGATLGWIIGRTAARNGAPDEEEETGRAWRLSPLPGGAVLSRRF